MPSTVVQKIKKCDPLPHDMQPSTLLCQLLLARVTPVSLNAVLFFIFKLTVSTAQTDVETDEI